MRNIVKGWEIIFWIVLFPTISYGQILFQEFFEDLNVASRGWYDNTNLPLSAVEHITGSTNSAEFHFLQGAAKPVSGAAIRKKFAETEEIYLSFYIKHSTSWVGSGRPYHPHIFYFLTNENGNYDGLAYDHLTAYIEETQMKLQLGIQDAQNIDESKIGQDLTNATERRAVAGCNGPLNDGYTSISCYLSGSVHRNGKDWKTANVYFSDAPGIYYKNDWHFLEAYFKLNSISGGIGQADGIIRYWYDRALAIERTNVIMRTGIHPSMKFNQFIIAPYIGDGSPVDQTFWIDNLTIATSRPIPDLPPAPAQNLRIVQ